MSLGFFRPKKILASKFYKTIDKIVKIYYTNYNLNKRKGACDAKVFASDKYPVGLFIIIVRVRTIYESEPWRRISSYSPN